MEEFGTKWGLTGVEEHVERAKSSICVRNISVGMISAALNETIQGCVLVGVSDFLRVCSAGEE